MRIISQDGMMDVPYERYCFGLDYRNTCNVIAWDMLSSSKDIMGNYNSKEKAMKAMEMLRNAYVRMPVIFKNVEVSDEVVDMFKKANMYVVIANVEKEQPKIEYVNNVVFQFPKDEEVEV